MCFLCFLFFLCFLCFFSRFSFFFLDWEAFNSSESSVSSSEVLLDLFLFFLCSCFLSFNFLSGSIGSLSSSSSSSLLDTSFSFLPWVALSCLKISSFRRRSLSSSSSESSLSFLFSFLLTSLECLSLDEDLFLTTLRSPSDTSESFRFRTSGVFLSSLSTLPRLDVADLLSMSALLLESFLKDVSFSDSMLSFSLDSSLFLIFFFAFLGELESSRELSCLLDFRELSRIRLSFSNSLIFSFSCRALLPSRFAVESYFLPGDSEFSDDEDSLSLDLECLAGLCISEDRCLYLSSSCFPLPF